MQDETKQPEEREEAEESREHGLRSSSGRLDAGLAAAFEAQETTNLSSLSVLESLRSRLASVPQVLLRAPVAGDSAFVNLRSEEVSGKADTLGRYQLYGEIARGGMGVILQGRDSELGRELVFKALLSEHRNNPDMLHRFVEEAQVGGQLQHPGTVPVYDMGLLDDGRPFFTMKLVKGKTLAALLTERAQPADDRARFLSIFERIARTIAYAHARGVIHRDLKPANIMVGAFGEVQVMDWGLARVLASGGAADERKAEETRTATGEVRTVRSGGAGSGFAGRKDTVAGSVLGTPAYMAPEQARGDVSGLDERVDVFGLGAILTEILTGEPPFSGDARQAHRQARNGDVSGARKQLESSDTDADLVDLAMRCIAPEKADRPHTAEVVADELADYLESVESRLREAELERAAQAARADEEARRREEAQGRAVAERRARRTTIALAATVLLAVVLGGGFWLWREAERDSRRAFLESEIYAALEHVTQLRAEAANASGDSLADARKEAERAAALAETGPVRSELRARVEALVSELDDEERDRRLLLAVEEARLAAAEPDSRKRHYATSRAVPYYREALRRYGLSAGSVSPQEAAARVLERPGPVRAALVAAFDDWIAVVDEHVVVEPHLHWLEEVVSRIDPSGWRASVREASRIADRDARRKALADLAAQADVARQPVASLVAVAERLSELEAVEAARTLLERALERAPGDFWLNEILGTLLVRQETALDDAARYLTAAVALRPSSVGPRLNLGHVLLGLGKLNMAEKVLEKAVALEPRSAKVHSQLGEVLRHKGEFSRALASARRAIELEPNDVWFHNNLGVVLWQQRELEKAEASFRRALEISRHGEIYSNLGLALQGQGRIEEATRSFRTALELEPDFPMALTHLGSVLLAHSPGEGFEEAESLLRRSNELRPGDVKTLVNLGVIHAQKGDLDGAIALWRELLQIIPGDAMTHLNIARALLTQGKFAEALDFSRRGLELSAKYPTQKEPAEDLIRRSKRFVVLDARLSGILAGELRPTSASEAAEYADVCHRKKQYADSARFYREAFSESPELAEDLASSRRYDAACSAVLAAATAQGGAEDLDAATRADWRAQAHKWLSADLAAWVARFDGDGEARGEIQEKLTHWQRDPDLRGIRDVTALEKLSAEERESLEGLWAEVDALLERSR